MQSPLLVQGEALQALAADLESLAESMSPTQIAGPSAVETLQAQVLDAVRAFDRNWLERRQELDVQLRGAAAWLRNVDCTFSGADAQLGTAVPVSGSFLSRRTAL